MSHDPPLPGRARVAPTVLAALLAFGEAGCKPGARVRRRAALVRGSL